MSVAATLVVACSSSDNADQAGDDKGEASTSTVAVPEADLVLAVGDEAVAQLDERYQSLQRRDGRGDRRLLLGAVRGRGCQGLPATDRSRRLNGFATWPRAGAGLHPGQWHLGQLHLLRRRWNHRR
ncbi:MAG: hypothetical protein IPG97_00375 [Microthrixaceae bacterium]|nr:hypothetical protein [Microthrixaceae bacterium]